MQIIVSDSMRKEKRVKLYENIHRELVNFFFRSKINWKCFHLLNMYFGALFLMSVNLFASFCMLYHLSTPSVYVYERTMFAFILCMCEQKRVKFSFFIPSPSASFDTRFFSSIPSNVASVIFCHAGD